MGSSLMNIVANKGVILASAFLCVSIWTGGVAIAVLWIHRDPSLYGLKTLWKRILNAFN
jgi:hypothetical protein